MGKNIEALLRLQSVERQLAQIRGKLRSRQNAVAAQQRRIQQLQEEYQALHNQYMDKRKAGDRLDLDLKTREEQVAKLRTNLNTARTNKEYAAILTQINTAKADNLKFEEEALRLMQQADAIKAEADKVQEKVNVEEARLEEVRQQSQSEIERLTAMLEEHQAKREDVARAVPPEMLSVFERIAESYDGEAMAVIEVHGKRPPHDYVCGGCFMALNAEHVNALRVRDEIRTCDNCRRILYLEVQTEGAGA